MKAIHALLYTMVDDASENFFMLRDSKDAYADPRTDFFLGKMNAIQDLMTRIDVIVEKED